MPYCQISNLVKKSVITRLQGYWNQMYKWRTSLTSSCITPGIVYITITLVWYVQVGSTVIAWILSKLILTCVNNMTVLFTSLFYWYSRPTDKILGVAWQVWSWISVLIVIKTKGKLNAILAWKDEPGVRAIRRSVPKVSQDHVQHAHVLTLVSPIL